MSVAHRHLHSRLSAIFLPICSTGIFLLPRCKGLHIWHSIIVFHLSLQLPTEILYIMVTKCSTYDDILTTGKLHTAKLPDFAVCLGLWHTAKI